MITFQDITVVIIVDGSVHLKLLVAACFIDFMVLSVEMCIVVCMGREELAKAE